MGEHKHNMNGENMQKNLAVAVSVVDLIDADEHNGRVFIEVPVTAAVYDQLRFRATDNNSSVSDEAARVLSSVVVD
jgi:hypothetical protein